MDKAVIHHFWQQGKRQVKLSLNPGAYIRKALKRKPFPTYWSYEGSLTSPGNKLFECIRK